MKNELIKVNRQIVDIMNMNRHDRRRIAKLNGVKGIPSIINVKVVKQEPPKKDENNKEDNK